MSHPNQGREGILAKYSKFCHGRPYAIVGSIVAFLLSVAFLAFITGSLNTTEGDDGEWLIKTDTVVKRWNAIEEAVEELEEQQKTALWERSEDDDSVTVQIVFRSKSGNALTEDNLREIREVESLLVAASGYPSYCLLRYNSSGVSQGCSDLPFSVSAFFYGLTDGNEAFGTSMDFNARLQALADARVENSFFLDKGFTPENKVSKHTRSLIRLGLPLPGFNGTNDDDVDDQSGIVYDKLLSKFDESMYNYLGMKAGFLKTELTSTGSTPNGDLEVFWFHLELMSDEFDRIVMADFLLAAFSLIAVLIYVTFHTGSPFLASFGMYMIVMAFFCGLFLYRRVFQVDYFGSLHFLIMFVMLGIGADDLFVFADAFKQSRTLFGAHPDSLLQRLSYTSMRASKAVFVTSFTTVAAFLATAISKIMPIASFGIFAGTSILCLFLIFVLLTPPVLIIWSRNWEGLPFWVCGTRCLSPEGQQKLEDFRKPLQPPAMASASADDAVLPPDAAAMDAPASKAVAGPHGAGTARVGCVTMCENAGEGTPVGADSTDGLRAIERFFNGPYISFLMKARIPVVILFIVILALSVFFAAKLSPPEEAEDFLPSSHSLVRALDLTGNDGPFLASSEDDVTEVDVVWGIDTMDTSGTNPWHPEDKGKVVYDDAFDGVSVESQNFLLTVCTRARAVLCEAKGCEPDPDGVKWLVRGRAGQREGLCFLNNFNEWLQRPGGPGALPIADPTLYLQLLQQFASDPAGIEFRNDIGVMTDESTGQLVLRWMRFTFNSTFVPPQSQDVTEDVVKEWDDFVDELNAAAPEGLNRSWATGGYVWAWLQSQKELVSSAISGMLLCFALAFIVINIATLNYRLAVIALVTIVGIVMTVLGLGIVGIMDWDLGVAEAIAVVILIGFSMDYCLHICDSYVEAHAHSRQERVRTALTNMGISIVAGAVTTFLAGVFLFFATLVFFTKFAFFIVATVVSAALWSLVFLPSVLLLVGPEREQGSWVVVYRMLRPCCGGPRSNTERLPQEVEIATHSAA